MGGRTATITIERGRSAGFSYQLSVDDEEIERDIGISAAGLAGELGTHYVRPQVDNDGFGMTLANCGQRQDGVVVLELEPGFPAHRAGLLVGDIILSVGEENIVDTNVIIDKLSDVTGEVILEVAGNSPSRLVTIPNPHAAKTNGSLTLSDTACGVGVYVSAVEAAKNPSVGAGRLDVGDIILSVDGPCIRREREGRERRERGNEREREREGERGREIRWRIQERRAEEGARCAHACADEPLSCLPAGAVTESARETMKYIARAPDPLTFVVAGRELMVGAVPVN